MGTLINILIIRKVILTVLFLSVSVICSAPVIDFRLILERFKYVSAVYDNRFHESELVRFINDLGFRESGNNWMAVNLIGCFGEWQFRQSTLKFLGLKNITLKKFRANPNIFPREMQIHALKALIRVNMVYLKDYEKYIGKTIRGVEITRSGMMAASHLGGAGSVKKFLDSGGRINRKDALGTSISDYLKKFSSYDVK